MRKSTFVSGIAVMTVAAAAFAPAGASASRTGVPLTKVQYLADLRAATTQSVRAENAALGSLQAKGTTASQVRAKFRSWGKTESKLGASFAALNPPAAAKTANSHLASAERTFGSQLTALAARFSATKVGIAKLLLGTNLTGKTLVDRALAELRAAGFKT